jgi:hypothetical protein
MATSLRAAANGAARAGSLGTKLALFVALLGCGAAFAQATPPVAPKIPPPAAPATMPTTPSPAVPPAPCIQPAPMIQWQDYKGRFADVVGFFGKKLEIKSTSPHGATYKTGTVLCTLTTKGKARLFVDDFTNPVTFVGAAFNAGIDQAENGDPRFGQEFGGYAKRFAANVADQANAAFFKDLVYPTVFSQDPRYYRLGRGGAARRIVHALSHAVIAHHENGAPMFNYTEWLGTATTVALSSTYHGYNSHGVPPYVESGAIGIANDAGFDILREFWPDIVHKLKLPFRAPRQPAT